MYRSPSLKLLAQTSGVALVEAAMTIPLIAFLIFGGIELSLMIQADEELSTLARETGISVYRTCYNRSRLIAASDATECIDRNITYIAGLPHYQLDRVDVVVSVYYCAQHICRRDSGSSIGPGSNDGGVCGPSDAEDCVCSCLSAIEPLITRTTNPTISSQYDLTSVNRDFQNTLSANGVVYVVEVFGSRDPFIELFGNGRQYESLTF